MRVTTYDKEKAQLWDTCVEVVIHTRAIFGKCRLFESCLFMNQIHLPCMLGPMIKKKLDWDTRLKIALGAAQGLAYLHHDCSPRIIHRDVKSSNILLDKDFEAHLTDFGIAKSLCVSKSHTSTYLMGTIGYIDPEYARTSRLTEKSDVYSYGIVLLELLTGRKAVDNESNLHHLVGLLSSSFTIVCDYYNTSNLHFMSS